MFERPSGGERAVLVQLDLGQSDFKERLDEFAQLVQSAGATVVATVRGKRHAPDAATFAGKGKVAEIESLCREQECDLVLFNHDLSPGQQRNLERALGCRVLDRNSLILDIFALRARSHEGKLQVELAQLQYLSTRLVRGWTHLERQKGGIGLRGPGETQLETDRRLLGERVKTLKSRLEMVERQRGTRRRARERRAIPAVSLIGYTNAGKSTLFNALAHARAYAADQLFATLDTTSRKLYLGEGASIVLSDTVGFIRDLPHSLVAAFHATLEETVGADLMLHVVDASAPDRDAQIDAVNAVLKEIGAQDVPQLVVWNKIDRLSGVEPGVEADDCGTIIKVRLSAMSGVGLDVLRAAIVERLFSVDQGGPGQMCVPTEPNMAAAFSAGADAPAVGTAADEARGSDRAPPINQSIH